MKSMQGRNNPDKWLVAPMYSQLHNKLMWRVWRLNIWTPVTGVYLESIPDAHQWILEELALQNAKRYLDEGVSILLTSRKETNG